MSRIRQARARSASTTRSATGRKHTLSRARDTFAYLLTQYLVADWFRVLISPTRKTRVCRTRCATS